MSMRTKGNVLAVVFAGYTLGVMLFTFWLSNNPLGEPRIFLREPGLALHGETEEERLAALEAAANLPADTNFDDYDDKYLTRLALVARDGTVKNELDNSFDYKNLPDFSAITVISERKKAFFDYLRPAVQFQNQLVRERRVILKGIEITLKSNQALSQSQQKYMDLVRSRYKVPEELSELDAVDLLMRRMDTIPVSMVLAQAALESAWGQSRFAREANNLFGQWCFSEGCGLVPNNRPAGETYEVATFESVDQAIAAYFQNINAFHRYSSIRDIRETARRNQKPLLGYDMVAGLEAYSSRGQDYIEELRKMIRYNDLE
ncbi:glucosaminidase domain-containing protein [Simiduia curdlanivorans]|uniref:Glucosaminidase domain-containing protein n=1 Tax=Simiduia curdlanivorans TaxID=1492769 RepID=A0ABV8V5S9_9GAMM|nr:glucosaminidase domain-containing protein [Simiduia curdlanivorans]MDN3638205.1 glucosaminidase domain-containing protein [Simiduia curdlanivorans]